MLSPLRRRAGRRLREPFGKAGLTVAVIALVFAMLGGAYAASKLTSKQKKEVEKIAKKFQGTGPAGSQGPAGANGKDGANGTNGKDGLNGKDGTNGTNGADGTDGTDGNSVTSSPVLVGDSACGGRGGAIYEIENVADSETEICNGSVGQDAGFNYTFNASVAEADPGAGDLALNNAAPASVTKLSISETDVNGNALAPAILKWTTGVSSQGTLMIRKVGNPSTFAEYTVGGGIACTTAQQKGKPNQCGMRDEGAFESINVAFVAGNGTLTAADPVTIAYSSSGSPTLPKGAIETGSWSFSRSVDTFTVEVGGTPEQVTVGASERIMVPLPLSTPLAASIEEGSKVHWSGEEATFGNFCEGNIANIIPKNSGEVCVWSTEIFNTSFDAIFPSVEFQHLGVGNTGFSRLGGVLSFTKPTGNAYGLGNFAVKG